jgi:hypothetical protein
MNIAQAWLCTKSLQNASELDIEFYYSLAEPAKQAQA